MNFNELMLPTSDDLIYREKDHYVWCGTMFDHNSSYYLIYSRWPKELGFQAWVTHSEVCLAKADSMLGEFKFVKLLFDRDTQPNGTWRVVHNPTVIKYHEKIYLYFVFNYGSGDWWGHRNNQRVGVAYCDDPEGEWTFVKEPVIDISEEGIDSLMTSNPTACVTPDDKVLMVYKAVDKYGEMPKGGKVLCGAAIADSPLGPFRKYGKPIFENPENDWSVEDPFMWYQDGKYHTIVKDFHGYFTGLNKTSWALFVSDDGFDWRPDEYPLAYVPQLDYGNGNVREVRYTDRPQLYIENGVPKLLCSAIMELTPDNSYKNVSETYNIRIPLKF